MQGMTGGHSPELPPLPELLQPLLTATETSRRDCSLHRRAAHPLIRQPHIGIAQVAGVQEDEDAGQQDFQGGGDGLLQGLQMQSTGGGGKSDESAVAGGGG